MSSLLPANKSFWLQHLCETNYDKLQLLLPGVAELQQLALQDDSGKPTLHARQLERTPYTVTLELTHHFAAGDAINVEPAVQVRIFLDAKLAEVMCADSTPAICDALRGDRSPRAVLDYKWRANYFLQKWLDHCLRHNYRPASAECGACT